MKVVARYFKKYDKWGKRVSESRYVCVDENTGEVLDDAQGYGYKTVEKAYAAWYYKHPSPKQKEVREIARKDVESFLKGKDREELREDIEYMDFQAQKSGLRDKRYSIMCEELGFKPKQYSAKTFINTLYDML